MPKPTIRKHGAKWHLSYRGSLHITFTWEEAIKILISLEKR